MMAGMTIERDVPTVTMILLLKKYAKERNLG